jgi:hypothetical protein
MTCFVIPNVCEESGFFILKSYLTLPLSYFLGEGIAGRCYHADEFVVGFKIDKFNPLEIKDFYPLFKKE